MIEIDCPICKSNEYDLLFVGRDRVFDIPGEFNVVKCVSCGLVYLNPQPEISELKKGYDAWDRGRRSSGDLGTRERIMRCVLRIGYARKMNQVESNRIHRRGRLLDVGCGNGGFLKEARRRGWQIAGIELSDIQAEHVRRTTGGDVRTGELWDCGFEQDAFDAITMWHVLEHLPDPIATLTEAHRLLKPGGVLVLSVPDCSSWTSKLFGKYWVGYEVPRHLCDFDPWTLELAMNKSGFTVIEPHYVMGTWEVIANSLAFVIKDKIGSRTVKRILHKIITSPFLSILFNPITMLCQRLGKGAIITVCAVAEKY